MAKKKSPLKGADPVLYKGAYEAAGGALYQKYVQDHHDAMMRISKELSSWDFGTGAQRIIDSDGRLPQGEINNIREKLGGQMRDDYINGDNAKKEEITAQTQKIHQDMTEYGTLRQSIAENTKGDNFSKGWRRTPMAQEVLELMKDETRLKEKECPEGVDDCDDKGSMGVMMTDHKKIAAAQNHIANLKRQINNMEDLYRSGGTYYDGTDLDALYEELREHEEFVKSKPQKWTSITEIKNGIQMVDQGAIELIAQARSAAYQKGKNVLPEDDVAFNRDSARQVVEESIMGPSNMLSLVYDPMFGKKSFYDNLVSSITGDKYSDYGITDEQVYVLGDLDANGIIDEREAELIAQEFIGTDLDNNEDLQREMSDYLVQHLENNYNLGVNENRESYLKDEAKKSDEVDDKEIKSDFDDDGNYIPQSRREQTYTPQSVEKIEEENTKIVNEENDDTDDDIEEEDDI